MWATAVKGDGPQPGGPADGAFAAPGGAAPSAAPSAAADGGAALAALTAAPAAPAASAAAGAPEDRLRKRRPPAILVPERDDESQTSSPRSQPPTPSQGPSSPATRLLKTLARQMALQSMWGAPTEEPPAAAAGGPGALGAAGAGEADAPRPSSPTPRLPAFLTPSSTSPRFRPNSNSPARAGAALRSSGSYLNFAEEVALAPIMGEADGARGPMPALSSLRAEAAARPQSLDAIPPAGGADRDSWRRGSRSARHRREAGPYQHPHHPQGHYKLQTKDAYPPHSYQQHPRGAAFSPLSLDANSPARGSTPNASVIRNLATYDHRAAVLELKFVISKWQAGLLIGVGGERIQSLRDASGAGMLIKKQGEQTRDRLLFIRGPPSAVHSAVELWLSRVAAAEKRSVEKRPLKARERAALGSMGRKENATRFRGLRMLVADAAAAAVVGPKCDRLKAMRAALGVEIHITAREEYNAEERMIEVNGAFDAIATVVLSVANNIAQEFLRKPPTRVQLLLQTQGAARLVARAADTLERHAAGASAAFAELPGADAAPFAVRRRSHADDLWSEDSSPTSDAGPPPSAPRRTPSFSFSFGAASPVKAPEAPSPGPVIAGGLTHCLDVCGGAIAVARVLHIASGALAGADGEIDGLAIAFPLSGAAVGPAASRLQHLREAGGEGLEVGVLCADCGAAEELKEEPLCAGQQPQAGTTVVLVKGPLADVRSSIRRIHDVILLKEMKTSGELSP